MHIFSKSSTFACYIGVMGLNGQAKTAVKRIAYIGIVLLTCTIMVAGGLLMLARSARVQTAIISLLTEELSRGLGVDAHIDRVHFKPLRSLDVEGVYLSDQAGDTLLYVPYLSVEFDPFAIEEDRLRFPKIEVTEPYLSLRQDTASTNIDFLLRAFAPEDTLPTQLPMPLSLEKITVTGAKVRYQHIPSGNDVMLRGLDADVRLPYVGNDSLSAQLVGLRLQAALKDVDATVKAEFHGDIDSVFADHLEVTYRNQRLLLGTLAVRDPLHLQQTNVVVNCQDLFCNRQLLSCFLSDIYHHPVTLPDYLGTLGDMHYHGLLSGTLDDLHLHGAFVTRLGTLTTLGTLSADTTFRDIRFTGEISTRRFRLGGLLPNAGFGTISFKTTASARLQKDQPLAAQGLLHITSLVYKGYTYRNLRIKGETKNNIFHGSVDIADPNLTLSLQGTMNFSSTDPWAEVALQLDHLRLHELHLYDNCRDEDAHCRMRLTFGSDGQSGTWIDRSDGQLYIDSLYITNFGEELRMKSFLLKWNEDNRKVSLVLLSDFLNAGISGNFQWSTLGTTMARFAHELFPKFLPKPAVSSAANDIDFYFYFRNLDAICRICGLQMHVANSPTVKGFIHESERQYDLQCFVPTIENNNAAWQNLTLSLRQRNKEALMAISCLEHTINLDSTQLRLGDIGFRLTAVAQRDSVYTALHFGNTDAEHQDAEILVNAHLGRYHQKPLYSVHVCPSVFYLRDTAWTLADSHIEYCQADTTLSVEHFAMQTLSGTQFMRANGIASMRETDSIRVDLNNFDLEYFLQYVGLQKTISIKGLVSGWATLYSLFRAPMFEANLCIPDARLNDVSLGDVCATATLDEAHEHILIEGNAIENGRRVAHVDGNVIPKDKYWELYIHADSANLAFINFWTDGILEDIEGRGYGNIHVFGKRLDTWVTAKAYAKDAALTIPFTGARYYFSDSVTLDTTHIAFDNIRIRDKEGHRGVINGRLEHDRFKDFRFNIRGNFQDLLALDIPYSSQAMFYGKAYASGSVDVHGDESMTDINISAATRGKTDFYLCVATSSDARDNSFINFVNPEEKKKPVRDVPIAVKPAKFRLSLGIEATPDAQVHILLDPHTGDGIIGRGEGILRLTMNGGGDIGLFGSYSLLSGTFSYAIGNIIRRDFAIAEGSSISWGGNPMTPVLNVKAIYRLTASLKDLFGSDITNLATNRTSVPVECILNISDKLFDPTLRFGIELPQSDEAVASQVKAIINTDEMLMRQVVYLLVFNRFFTPEYLQANSSQSTNSTYSLLSSTVTGQINQWLSKLTDIVSVGFNVRSDGEGANASQEYETQFQIHPVNRLSINGNFGYRYNDLSNRPFFGDVDIEYQLTSNGKLRARAFTHTVDKYSLKQANTVQGIGLVFRHDFNWGDARRKRQAKRQQETEKQ